jgi:hypothetical protein
LLVGVTTPEKFYFDEVHYVPTALPISAAFVGTTMQTFNRLMIFKNWI